MINNIFHSKILYLNSKYFEYSEYFDILIPIILKRFVHERFNESNVVFIKNTVILKFTINFDLCKNFR